MTDNAIEQLKTDIELLKLGQLALMQQSLKDAEAIKELKTVVVALMMRTPEFKAALDQAKADCECNDCKPETTAAPATSTETQ